MEESITCREAALRYAAMGWRVVPTSGKIPVTTHGHLDASADERQITKWWRCHPDANVAIVTGNGLAVLDVDKKSKRLTIEGDELDTNGFDSLFDLEEEHGRLPETLTVDTGGGGVHYLLSADGPQKCHNGFRPGLDWKAGGGGYIVAAPSTHASGKRYSWRNWGCRIAPAPQWLLNVMRPEQPAVPVAAHSSVPATDRVTRRARAFLAKMPPGIQGENGTRPTFTAAATLVRRFALSVSDALPLLREYSDRCCPPWREDELLRMLSSAVHSKFALGDLLIDKPHRQMPRAFSASL